MGSDHGMPYEAPVHEVTVNSYWIDKHEVTVAEFEKFVNETGYVTEGEKIGWSGVFDTAQGRWTRCDKASWRNPDCGAKKANPNEPVTQVSWADANAYAKWVKKRLPTEAEFEFAARGGLDRNRFAWGNDLKPGGAWVANIWQGRFPSNNLAEDGYVRTSPVTAFPANGFGLYDVGGNVWQWCADWYRPDYFATLAANGVARSPQGPPDSYDPREPGIRKRVQKGGSFLCSDRYCSRYLVGSRGRGAIDSGGSNTGFRCVKSP